MSTPPSDAALPRSYLYVPADREKFLASARTHGADAVILDLEDGVAPAHKAAARELLQDWLPQQANGDDEIWIRVNQATAADDARLAAHEQVRGIVLPKATADSVGELDAALTVIERDTSRRERVQVIPLIESAAALEAATDVASSPRVVRLGIGRADLFAELGLAADTLTIEHVSALWLRIVVASAAAGRAAPIAPTETRLHDLAALEATTEEFAALGFRARTAIHPEQIAGVNRVFSPSAEEVASALEILHRFDSALEQGEGVFVEADGVMVDEAVVRQSRAVLRRARLTERPLA